MAAQKSDNPPFFPEGTVVSARYRGAYCSAVVSKLLRKVEVKVVFEKPELGSRVVLDDSIHGSLVPGNLISVRYPGHGLCYKATVMQVRDKSVYTVVYDDGDTSNLKRSKLCAPGARHFRESDSLDRFPLLNPEEFGAPVMVNDANRAKEKINVLTGARLGQIQTDQNTSHNHVFSSPTDPLVAPAQRHPVAKASSRKPTKKSKKRLEAKARPIDITDPKQPNDARPEKEPNPPTTSDGTTTVLKSHTVTYFYVTPDKQKTTNKVATFSQKRKAFIPTQVVKVLTPVTPVFSGKVKKKCEVKTEDIEDLLSSSNANVESLSETDDSTKRSESAVEPEVNTECSTEDEDKNKGPNDESQPEQEESNSCFDYTHKKLRLKGDFSSLPSGEVVKLVTVPLVISGEKPSPRPINLLCKELSEIVTEKNVEVAEEPPTGGKYNFIPNLENVTDPIEREKLIRNSIEAVVLQYFDTKGKLDKLGKPKK